MIRRHALLTFFALAYAISWFIWAPLWLPRFGVDGLPVMPFHHALGALGPIVAAFLVSNMDAGCEGALDLLRRMGFWRHRVGWLLFALLGPLVMFGLAVLGSWIFLVHRPLQVGFGVSREFPEFLPLAFFVYNVLTFGYGKRWDGEDLRFHACRRVMEILYRYSCFNRFSLEAISKISV